MARTQVRPERMRLVRLALALEWLSIAWLVIEAGLGIAAAVLAGSAALLAFGLDSGIELVSAVVMVWRLGVEQRGGDQERVERAERRAALIVGWSLFALAVYIIVDVALTLLLGAHPAPTPLGVAVATAALIVMPTFVRAKRRVARRISSAALRGDAAENVVCAYMAGVLLIGLAARAWLGWWWADSVAALGIVYFIVREGQEALEEAKGEGEEISDDD